MGRRIRRSRSPGPRSSSRSRSRSRSRSSSRSSSRSRSRSRPILINVTNNIRLPKSIKVDTVKGKLLDSYGTLHYKFPDKHIPKNYIIVEGEKKRITQDYIFYYNPDFNDYRDFEEYDIVDDISKMGLGIKKLHSSNSEEDAFGGSNRYRRKTKKDIKKKIKKKKRLTKRR